MQPQTTSTASSLDPQVVNLAKSIRQVESGGNFQAQGKSGEYGGYQFTEPTWNATAKKYGVNIPLKNATPEQQNEVAYKQLKEWKDSGYNVGEIASMWNSGKPDAYLKNNVGINDHGVSYNTPEYAKKVATQYQSLKGQSSQSAYNPTPYSTGANPFLINTSGDTQQAQNGSEEGLGSKLMGRANDASSAIQDTKSGKINPLSGIVQTVGAVAGGVNDVVQKGFELIPGVKSVEGLIGKGVKKLADTGLGQKVVGGIQNFSEAHPELSKDISSIGNIARVAGLATGAGAVKDAVVEAGSKAFSGKISSALGKEITEVASKTIGGRKALAELGEDGIKTLTQKEFAPTIETLENGKKVFSTKIASENIEQAIRKVDEEMLQPLLENGSTPAVSERMPLDELRKSALLDAKDAFIDDTGVNKLFDMIKEKYGDYPTLAQVNEAKRTVAKKITDAAFGTDSYTTNKLVRNSLQKGVEEGAEKLGLGDVNAINKEMSHLYKAQKLLTKIEGKSAKGIVGRFATKHHIITGLVKSGAKYAAEGIGGGVGYKLYSKFSGE